MHVAPVIAVTDLDRAREFYEGKLGLSGAASPGGWTLTAGAGTVIYLLPEIEEAGQAPWPVAGFLVEDVHATVRAWRARGVPFLGMDDVPFDLDEDGISVTEEMSLAWMRDPDGSILTVHERH